jgi:hypothetical protein
MSGFRLGYQDVEICRRARLHDWKVLRPLQRRTTSRPPRSGFYKIAALVMNPPGVRKYEVI